MKHFLNKFIIASTMMLLVSCDEISNKYSQCDSYELANILTCKDAKWQVTLLRDSSFTINRGSVWLDSTWSKPPHESKQDTWTFTKDHKVQTTLWGKVDWKEMSSNVLIINGIEYENLHTAGGTIDQTLSNEIEVTGANNSTKAERTFIYLSK